VIDPKQFVPSKAFLTKGVGRHREKLTSFELALRDARIAQYNLVRVSSIFPPQCALVSWEQGVKMLMPGQVVFAVVAEASTNEPSRLLSGEIVRTMNISCTAEAQDDGRWVTVVSAVVFCG
jgi:arginine decarboxylase